MRKLRVNTEAYTNHDSDSLHLYLREIRSINFLEPEEEYRLIKKIRKGDLNALEKLVSANLRFVISVAKHYQGQGLSFSDLISEGNLGLLKAAERFDETRGFKFISYAVWWIRQSIIQALTEHSRMVRLPRHRVQSLSKISKAFIQLEQEFEREPTTDELAHLLNLESDEVMSALGIELKQISIDAPINKEELKSLVDIIENPNADSPDHDIAHHQSLKNEIRFLLMELNPNQAEVVRMYFGIGGEEQMNLYEISRKLNLSSERIRQIKDAALIRIKKSKNYRVLKEYIGK